MSVRQEGFYLSISRRHMILCIMKDSGISLQLLGIPTKIPSLLNDFYFGTECCEVLGRDVSSFVMVNAGVKQDCPCPSLFNACRTEY